MSVTGRPERKTPAELTPGWPDAVSPDPDAEALRLLAVRLRDVAGKRSLRQLGQATGVNHAAIGQVIAGNTWPDTLTLSRLERGLEARLWPVLESTGSYVAASPDVVVGEDAEQAGRGDDVADGQPDT